MCYLLWLFGYIVRFQLIDVYLKFISRPSTALDADDTLMTKEEFLVSVVYTLWKAKKWLALC